MSNFTRQYAEMHYCYGMARGNGLLAERLYRQQLQRRGEIMDHYPDHRVFSNTHMAADGRAYTRS